MQDNSLSAIGLDIRARLPIAGTTATNAECVARAGAVAAALAELGEAVGERHWYTCRLADGRLTGIWADGLVEAIIEVALWSGAAVAVCAIDDDLTLRDAAGASTGGELFDLLELASE